MSGGSARIFISPIFAMHTLLRAALMIALAKSSGGARVGVWVGARARGRGPVGELGWARVFALRALRAGYDWQKTQTVARLD